MAIISEIRAALQDFGCKGYFNLGKLPLNRYCVTVNHRYFGVWDANKHTFVD